MQNLKQGGAVWSGFARPVAIASAFSPMPLGYAHTIAYLPPEGGG